MSLAPHDLWSFSCNKHDLCSCIYNSYKSPRSITSKLQVFNQPTIIPYQLPYIYILLTIFSLFKFNNYHALDAVLLTLITLWIMTFFTLVLYYFTHWETLHRIWLKLGSNCFIKHHINKYLYLIILISQNLMAILSKLINSGH